MIRGERMLRRERERKLKREVRPENGALLCD